MLDISSKYTDIEVVGNSKISSMYCGAKVGLARPSYSVR